MVRWSVACLGLTEEGRLREQGTFRAAQWRRICTWCHQALPSSGPKRSAKILLSSRCTSGGACSQLINRVRMGKKVPRRCLKEVSGRAIMACREATTRGARNANSSLCWARCRWDWLRPSGVVAGPGACRAAASWLDAARE